MSVLIKDFEMPKNCEECPFCDYEEGDCLATEKYYTTGEEAKNTLPHNCKRRGWCPLVEIDLRSDNNG